MSLSWSAVSLILLVGGTNATTGGGHFTWPTLPTTGFISGRPATQRDVADGNAGFSAEVAGEVIGHPLPITIPQYAIWTDGNGRKVPVVIIQAELARNLEIFGLKLANGESVICTRAELVLLGQDLPED